MRLLIKDPLHAAQFAAAFEQLGAKKFADLIVLRICAKGVYMQCVDAAQVCLFDTTLTEGWFDEYEAPVQAEGEQRIGVIPRVMASVLGTWRAGQSNGGLCWWRTDLILGVAVHHRPFLLHVLRRDAAQPVAHLVGGEA